MIDIQLERVLTLRQAAGTLPRRRDDRPTHESTLARWIDQGLDGVRLEGLWIGATRCTSAEALQRFFQRLTERKLEPQQTAGGDHVC